MSHEDLVLQLKALGEPTRLELALLLQHGEAGALALQQQLEISQPNLSRHLKVLREAGVIRERRSGRNAYYALINSKLVDSVLSLSARPAPPPTPRAKPMRESESKSDPPRQDTSFEEWLL